TVKPLPPFKLGLPMTSSSCRAAGRRTRKLDVRFKAMRRGEGIQLDAGRRFVDLRWRETGAHAEQWSGPSNLDRRFKRRHYRCGGMRRPLHRARLGLPRSPKRYLYLARE